MSNGMKLFTVFFVIDNIVKVEAGYFNALDEAEKHMEEEREYIIVEGVINDTPTWNDYFERECTITIEEAGIILKEVGVSKREIRDAIKANFKITPFILWCDADLILREDMEELNNRVFNSCYELEKYINDRYTQIHLYSLPHFVECVNSDILSLEHAFIAHVYTVS